VARDARQAAMIILYVVNYPDNWWLLFALAIVVGVFLAWEQR
jgi:hypothetical protein